MEEIKFSQQQIEAVRDQQRFMVRVYGWMTLALLTTAIVSGMVATSQTFLQMIVENRFLFFGIMILQLVLVGSLAGFAQRISAPVATLLFLGYAALTGVTFAFIFLAYTASSIATTFYITAGTFAVMSFFGYFTGTDLTKFGSILFMALIGLVIASIVNMFMHSEMIYWISTYAGVLIFTGLIAYDTQKIRMMAPVGMEGTAEEQKASIIGALSLYLDFINLFLILLRLFGRKK